MEAELEERIELVRSQDYFGVKKDVAERYIKSFIFHVNSVKMAGKQLNVSDSQLHYHDNSILCENEFKGYAMGFQGGGEPDLLKSAWLHHIHYNPHHWQHWILPDGFSPKNSKQVENSICKMPSIYALEMVADWMGSNFTRTNSWDMSEWLFVNIPRIKIHTETSQYLKEVMYELEYAELFKFVDFGNNILD